MSNKHKGTIGPWATENGFKKWFHYDKSNRQKQDTERRLKERRNQREFQNLNNCMEKNTHIDAIELLRGMDYVVLKTSKVSDHLIKKYGEGRTIHVVGIYQDKDAAKREALKIGYRLKANDFFFHPIIIERGDGSWTVDVVVYYRTKEEAKAYYDGLDKNVEPFKIEVRNKL